MNKDINNWYAIRTHKDFDALRVLSEYCDDVFLPTEEVKIPSTGRTRTRAVIPHVLFIKTTPSEALSLEKRGRDINDRMIQFWIYRYQKEGEIQKITEEEIRLIKLLTSNDTAKCEVFRVPERTTRENNRRTVCRLHRLCTASKEKHARGGGDSRHMRRDAPLHSP